jgi:hypothetical protein
MDKIRTLAVVVLLALVLVGGVGVLLAQQNTYKDALPLIEVYHSPTCGCCINYERYLEASGFKVKSVELDNVEQIKKQLNVPQSMWSCHTAKVGSYFVEGHVPVEAINKLLQENPSINGIALPGMPFGSPGMSGVKSGEFVIYAVSDGNTGEFVRI